MCIENSVSLIVLLRDISSPFMSCCIENSVSLIALLRVISSPFLSCCIENSVILIALLRVISSPFLSCCIKNTVSLIVPLPEAQYQQSISAVFTARHRLHHSWWFLCVHLQSSEFDFAR